MASNMLQEGPKSSASSNRLPQGRRSRKGSFTSVTSSTQVDKAVTQNLDQIHSTASRSSTLTTFNDFGPPPSSSAPNDDRGRAGHIVSAGLGGIYTRLKASVSGTKDKTETTGRPPTSEGASIALSTGNRPDSFWKQGKDPHSPSASVSANNNIKSPSLRDSVSSLSRSTLAPNASELSQLQQSPTSAAASEDAGVVGSIPEPFPRLPSPPHGISVVVQDNKSPERSPSTHAIARSSIPDGEVNVISIADGESARTSRYENTEKAVDIRKTSSRAKNSSQTEPANNVLMLNDVENAEIHEYHIAQRSPRTRPVPNPTATDEPSKNQLRPKIVRSARSTAADVVDSTSKFTFPTPSFTMDRAVTGNLGPKAKNQIGSLPPSQHSHQMRKKILSREFWMKDENAKVCFNCGDGFSTFRRKHHCRLCGQIYCSSCTNLVSGRPFGQTSKLRVCKTCEIMMNGDDSSEYTEDEEPMLAPTLKQIRFCETTDEVSRSSLRGSQDFLMDSDKRPTTSSSSVTSWKSREGKRRSLQGTPVPDRQPPLARPISSRSLKSMGVRPRSSSQKQRHSKHQHMRSLGVAFDDGAPFSQVATEATLPVFHTDSIIDPDLAPFMSDEGSSEEETLSIAAALSSNVQDQAGASQQGLFGALRRGRPPSIGKALQDVGRLRSDTDSTSVASSRVGKKRRQLGSRTISVGSLGHYGSTPRVIKSDNLFTSSDNLLALGSRTAHPGQHQRPGLRDTPVNSSSASRKIPKPGADLNRASLDYVKNLFRQFLDDAAIEGQKQWEKALIPVLLRCAEFVDPNIHRGDDIDIRHYVKLKKAAGGSPSDTSYVSGVVFTKNLALKDMPRSIQNPRVLLVSFPLVYTRHQQHFMSLEPIIAQEREYLRNLVNRIKALRPQVLLVQRDVAGLAVQFLHEARIAVAYNVKVSVMQAVARCTQTRIISSAEKLNISPHSLGRCESFDIKTYLCGNHRKTYIALAGCPRDLGCTIILRGATQEILHKLKWITEFMCYVAYNLKLEACLMRDEFVSTPSMADLKSPMGQANCDLSTFDGKEEINEVKFRKHGSEPAGEQQLQDATLDEPEILSTETGQQPANLPMPQTWRKTVGDLNPTGPYDVLIQECRQRLLSVSPFVKLPEPYLIMRGREQEQRMSHLRALRKKEQQMGDDSGKSNASLKFELLKPQVPDISIEQASPQIRAVLHAIHSSEYEQADYVYNTLKKRWETYIAGVQDPFSPLTHQRVIVLFSIVSTLTSDACEGPDLLGLGFYQEHEIDEGLEPDVPLGEYIERLCDQANSPCIAQRCDRNMIDHHRQYVHGEGQVSIYVRKYPSRFKGMENTILMWSCCRKCDHETQVTSMSGNSWKYSFGKYLELSFWSLQLHARAGSCPHDIHRDHKRYFGFKNLAVTVQYDPIRIMEVTTPRAIITWEVKRSISLKNEEYTKMEDRLIRFMSSVKIRIKSINIESIAPEKAENCKIEVEKLSKKANEEYDALIRKLQDKYMASKYYEILPLNRAMRLIQEKVAEWDIAFADFERDYFPSEKDIRRLATQQFRKVFLEREETSVADRDTEDHNQETREKEDVLEDEALPDSEKGDLEKPGQDLSAPLAANTIGMSEAQRPEPLSQPAVVRVMSSEYQRHENQIVQTLDLAIPLASAGGLNLGRKSIDTDDILSPVGVDGVRPNITLTKPNPLEPEVVAKVEQMSLDVNSEVDVESNKRCGETIAAPPLFRAQTQPSPSTNSSLDIPITSTEGTSSPTLELSNVLPPLNLNNTFLPTPPPSMGRIVERSSLIMPRTGKSMIPRAVPLSRNESKVSALAKHFEEMSREFEKERLRERRQRAARNRQSRAYPMVASKPIVELFRDAHEAVRERDTSYEELHDNSVDNRAQDSFESEQLQQTEVGETAPDTRRSSYADAEIRISMDKEQTTNASEQNQANASYPASEIEIAASDTEHPSGQDEKESEEAEGASDHPVVEAPELELPLDYISEIPKHEKSSLMKMLTRFWSERSASGWTPLEYPLVPTDHIFADSDVIVREDEPSSLIAFALASQDYNSKLHKFREKTKADRNALPTLGDVSLHEDDIDVERVMLGKTATHMKYQFQAGSAKMLCKVFYAEAFDAIRQKSGVADRFIESLSRCLKWDSKGGKTKSLFLKTLDERFVLKSLSTVETQAFLKFAPDYFDYMSKCLFHQLPSAMAKMLGFYQIVIKNPATGTEFNYFLQVMENVFYEGPTNLMFDLKGSMRNRRVHSTGEKDEVLLDENLLDYISQSPIYVRAHSNSVLASSITNDTLFCSKQNVMDYSLIVGLYDDRAQLHVGTIDYIRTYTWDKKLESWIKDRGKHKPTVMSPKDYRNRFRASIPRYFPLAPSCWQAFGAAQQGGVAARVPWVGGRRLGGGGGGAGGEGADGSGSGNGRGRGADGWDGRESEDA